MITLKSGDGEVIWDYYKDPGKERGPERQSRRRMNTEVGVLEAEGYGPGDAGSFQKLEAWRLVPWGCGGAVIALYRERR